jgi:hypothetical protein
LVTEPTLADDRSVVAGVRILSSRVDGPTATIDAVDEPGTIVLGLQDSYLYGLRLTAGPSASGGPQVVPVSFPAGLDRETRVRAEDDAALLIRTAPGLAGPRSPGDAVVSLNRGPLISTVRYEALENAVTEHVAVRVTAGGGFGAIPGRPAVLVCYAIVHSGLGAAAPDTVASPEPCGYPLTLSG